MMLDSGIGTAGFIPSAVTILGSLVTLFFAGTAMLPGRSGFSPGAGVGGVLFAFYAYGLTNRLIQVPPDA